MTIVGERIVLALGAKVNVIADYRLVLAVVEVICRCCSMFSVFIIIVSVNIFIAIIDE